MRIVVLNLLLAAAAAAQTHSIALCDQQSSPNCVTLTVPASLGSSSTITLPAGLTGNWTLSGSVLYNGAGLYVVAGATADDGSHASLQSASGASVTGTIQAIATGTAIGFQLANSKFSVDGNGNVSAAAAGNFDSISLSHTGIGNVINVTAATAFNSIATTGGFNADSAGGTAGAYAVNSTVVIDHSRNATFNNLTVGGTCTGCGTNYWTLSGSAIYNNVGTYVIAGATADDGSGASLQAASSASVTGTIQAIQTGTSIAFKTANNNFSVDGNGNVSGAGAGDFDSVSLSHTGIGNVLNVTAATAFNSIATTGGFNADSAGGTAGAYAVNSTVVIDHSRNATFNNLTIGGTCTGCPGGVTSLTGTADQVLVNGTSGTATTGVITLTLPQSIGTTSQVTFDSVILGHTGIGAVVSIPNATAFNSVETSGGFNADSAGGSASAYAVNSTSIIDSSRNAKLNHVISATGSQASQVNVTSGTSTTDSGLFLTSIAPGFAAMSGGMEFNGTNWIARDTSAGSMSVQSVTGDVVFTVNTGLTSGSSFTITKVGTINQSGFEANTGYFMSDATGSSTAFKTSNGNFIADGNGNLTLASAATADTITLNHSGIGSIVDVTAATAFNSIATTGGFNADSGGGTAGAYAVNSTVVIDHSRNASFANIAASGSVTTAITGSTQCLQVNSSGVLSGFGSGCGTSAGVSSLNSLTGGLSIAGTSNEVSVSPSGSTITLSTPQAIGTSSTPTFDSISLGHTGIGNVINVTAATAFNSIATTGGFNADSGGGSAGAYAVNSTVVINSSGVFVGGGVNVGSNGVSSGGYNIAGGFTGQTWTVTFGGGISGIGGCSSGLIIKGGVIVSCF